MRLKTTDYIHNATRSHCCTTLASAVFSFLGFQLHNFIKLNLCFSERGLYASNIANSDSVGKNQTSQHGTWKSSLLLSSPCGDTFAFKVWTSDSKAQVSFIAWEGVTLCLTSFIGLIPNWSALGVIYRLFCKASTIAFTSWS